MLHRLQGGVTGGKPRPMMDTGYDQITAAPPGFFAEEVTSVHHWTDRLFSFTCTRDASLRFTSGQFAMIGLLVGGKPLVRAYSMVSPAWQESLEFLSIKVQDGPLTSRLQHIKVGEKVLIGRKPVGTLILDNLLPGRNLWMLATGTGLAPFMSLMRDPEAYAKYDRVIIAHTVREVAELAWSPQAGRRWDTFRVRLGAQAPRWTALGINVYWSPKVDWQR